MKTKEPLTEKIVEDVARCRAAGYIATRLFISYKDLNKLVKERPDVGESGSFYGLSITLLSDGCPTHVLPKER